MFSPTTSFTKCPETKWKRCRGTRQHRRGNGHPVSRSPMRRPQWEGMGHPPTLVTPARTICRAGTSPMTSSNMDALSISSRRATFSLKFSKSGQISRRGFQEQSSVSRAFVLGCVSGHNREVFSHGILRAIRWFQGATQACPILKGHGFSASGTVPSAQT